MSVNGFESASYDYDRKKHDQQEWTSIPLTSSTSYSRNTAVFRNPQGAGYSPRRNSSPPASAYFPLLDDANPTTVVSPAAQDHFAYSTTLRRHQVDPGSRLNALRSLADYMTTMNDENEISPTTPIFYCVCFIFYFLIFF
ncbi:hypothetical protein M378DRAFT_25115 [Amanita muscaria Koide BX008]|uniref:Uncharacterized protein n=1 Tax=Amanita muscaria (strain Koide BX008) TaxID=946122 RepID=A0A0C2SJG9_AMAMK|nr:hypothetical protein M378DRAFT_25115 [Amanita muscaria Koide BX008]